MSSSYHYKLKTALTSSWDIPIKLNNISNGVSIVWQCLNSDKLKNRLKQSNGVFLPPTSLLPFVFFHFLSLFLLLHLTPQWCAIAHPAAVLSGDGCSLPVFFMTHMFISPLPTLSRLIITSFAVCWYAPGKKCLNFWMNNFYSHLNKSSWQADVQDYLSCTAVLCNELILEHSVQFSAQSISNTKKTHSHSLSWCKPTVFHWNAGTHPEELRISLWFQQITCLHLSPHMALFIYQINTHTTYWASRNCREFSDTPVGWLSCQLASCLLWWFFVMFHDVQKANIYLNEQ